MRCSHPLDAAVLADYWLAALSDSEEEAVELHLFDCDQCGERLREVMALADGVRVRCLIGRNEKKFDYINRVNKRFRFQSTRVRGHTLPFSLLCISLNSGIRARSMRR
jgi:hypothetical protein